MASNSTSPARPLIDARATSINLSQFARQHNAGIEYKDRANRLRGGLYLTAKCIVKDFIKAWKGERVTDGWYETSSSLIADYTMQSRHSVIRHVKKLIDIGILEGKSDSARRFGNNYRLKIASDLIEWIVQRVAAKPAATAEQITDELFEEKLSRQGYIASYLDGLLNSS